MRVAAPNGTWWLCLRSSYIGHQEIAPTSQIDSASNLLQWPRISEKPDTNSSSTLRLAAGAHSCRQAPNDSYQVLQLSLRMSFSSFKLQVHNLVTKLWTSLPSTAVSAWRSQIQKRFQTPNGLLQVRILVAKH